MTVLKCQPEMKRPEPEHLPSFESLYHQYHIRIYRYLRAHLKNDDDAADLTQQIFFQIWMRLSTYQPAKGSLSTWLFSIARHRLIDFLRASHTSISWEPLYEIAMTDFSPEEIVISAEIIAQVKALIDALSHEERELLALRFAARLSIVEIALLIGKSEEATKKQLARLLRRLREQYHHLEEDLQPLDSRGQQVPAFLSVLYQVYTVSPPVTRLIVLREIPFSHCLTYFIHERTNNATNQ
jgi:RNA polymerase sigma factor (sigma-70 family)